MAWCPKCKYEFREGITVCSDCGSELVDDLSLICEEETNILDNVSLSQMKELILNHSLMDESFNEEFEYDEEENEEFKEVYVNNEEKAEENKSSAYVLLSVGTLGFVAVVLFFMQIIPSNMSNSSRYIISGIMGVMFILFIVMGVVSVISFKNYKKEAYKENNLTAEIKKWCLENLIKDEIDTECELSSVSDELKYFSRVKYIKEKINNQFMNLEDAYLNRLIDEMYAEIFEQE